jgi:hypothetical protein
LYCTCSNDLQEAEEKARATLEELERVKAARAALLGVATAPALNKEGEHLWVYHHVASHSAERSSIS